MKPIPGAGANNPKFCFIFINPTIRNTSSHDDWTGIRAPFIGTKQVWRVFYNAQLISKDIYEQTQTTWTPTSAQHIYDYLTQKGYYLTNLVKKTGENADLPNRQLINEHLPQLKQELQIINPQHIVTMGLLPFQALTKKMIKLSEHYEQAIQNKKLTTYDNVIPCYFPTGRGNPKRATEMLRLLRSIQ